MGVKLHRAKVRAGGLHTPGRCSILSASLTGKTGKPFPG